MGTVIYEGADGYLQFDRDSSGLHLEAIGGSQVVTLCNMTKEDMRSIATKMFAAASDQDPAKPLADLLSVATVALAQIKRFLGSPHPQIIESVRREMTELLPKIEAAVVIAQHGSDMAAKTDEMPIAPNAAGEEALTVLRSLREHASAYGAALERAKKPEAATVAADVAMADAILGSGDK
jgi:sugar phosphate isomerase/epimerase